MTGNSEKITQTFNGLTEWRVPGGYFKLLDAPATVTRVELFLEGRRVLLADNVDAGYYQNVDFDTVKITNPVNQQISWLYAPGEGGSDRLTGTVAFVDGGKARTIAGQAFFAAAFQAAVAAQFGHAQLLNPAGSTKRAVLRQVLSGSGAAQLATLIRFDTALTTLVGNAPSKLIGGAASACEVRTQTNVGNLGTGNGLVFEYEQLNSTAPPIVLGEPIVLLPGRGILVRGGTLNVDLVANFEFFEEDNV